MATPTIEITAEPQPNEIKFLTEQLITFNRQRASDGNYQPLAIFLKDAEASIVGGLVGETYWQWLYVDMLWVHESCRGQGYGHTLLTQAEQAAMQRGCRYAYLDTFSFQAPQFYQKRGYAIFGELPNFPQGCSRFFLKKDLSETP